MNVLLWKLGALGDVVMTTPLVRQLRRQLPAARIDYLVGGNARVVLEGNPHLDAVKTFDERILVAPQPWRVPGLVALLRGYDQVFVLDKHWVFALVARLAGVPRRLGFRRRSFEGRMLTDSVPYGPLLHEVDYYLRLLEAAGLGADPDDRALELPGDEPYPIDGPYDVLVNSGGRNANEQSSVRRIPQALFGAFAQERARARRVVFVGDAGEHPYYEALAVPGALNLCGRITLRQAWSVLRGADEVVSTDCGLMHMAAAVNPHVTGVFGPTHPGRKCPPGARFVWKDAARYVPGYELFGRLPHGQ